MDMVVLLGFLDRELFPNPRSARRRIVLFPSLKTTGNPRLSRPPRCGWMDLPFRLEAGDGSLGREYNSRGTYAGSGTNFAVFSEAAKAVYLCLFDSAGSERRIAARSSSCLTPGPST
jgi:hypothetical protein